MSATEPHQIAEQYHLRRSGNRWAGPCPKCGGSETTDRFVLFADGGYKCFSCGWGGTRVSWLRQIEGMGCREAHDYLGEGCSTSCPQYASCRQGQPRQARQPRALQVPTEAARQVAPLRAATVSPIWQAWAAGFVARCAANLAHQPEALAWLAARGIDAAAAQQNRLGWCAHDLRVDRAELGLPPDTERPRVWVPAGLVIPVVDVAGQITRVKIRRPDAAREKFLPERKYSAIPGGSALPMVLGRSLAAPRGAVVVEAELDAIACHVAVPEVVVVGLGSVSMGVDEELRALLERMPVILVALDNDPDRDGRPAPGQAATSRWWQTWRRARGYQVPAGKDPGDYVRDHGGDLRAWLSAGLPVRPRGLAAPAPVVAAAHPATADHDRAGSPAQAAAGGEGESDSFFVRGPDGEEHEVVRTAEAWRQARAEGREVWSPRELADVQRAVAGLDPEAKAAAVRAVIEARRVFGGFVAAGRAGTCPEV